jgi:hypothetical protein
MMNISPPLDSEMTMAAMEQQARLLAEIDLCQLTLTIDADAANDRCFAQIPALWAGFAPSMPRQGVICGAGINKLLRLVPKGQQVNHACDNRR